MGRDGSGRDVLRSLAWRTLSVETPFPLCGLKEVPMISATVASTFPRTGAPLRVPILSWKSYQTKLEREQIHLSEELATRESHQHGYFSPRHKPYSRLHHQHSYWAAAGARRVERSIENSMAFGLYHGDQQVGFARIVTDYATFAWVADVFVVPEHRGRGLSKWLMEVIIAHPKLQGFRRWVLATKDAHGLYEQFGFIKLPSDVGWHDPIRT